MSCIELEHQTDGITGRHADYSDFVPEPGWLEVDHATDNVSYHPIITPGLFVYFDLIVDPNDERNQWLAPKEGVEFLATKSYSPEHDDSNSFRYTYPFLMPDGQAGAVIYEDGSVSNPYAKPRENRIAKLDLPTEPVQQRLLLLNSLGKHAIK